MTQNPLLTSQTTPNQPQIHGLIHHPLIPLKQENQNFNLPPWLSAEQHGACGPAPPINPLFTSPRLDQSTIQENPNPNNIPTTFSSSSSSFMSATALLQKAAQMGVTMSTKMPYQSSDESSFMRPHHHVGAPGFCATSSTTTAGLPSREEMGTGFVHGLASFGNKLVNLPSGCMELQDMNMMGSSCLPSTSGFDGSLAFEDSFNGMLNPKRNITNFQENAHLMSVRKEGGGGGSGSGSGGGAGGGGGGDGLTRDFLGLRAFPGRDFSNMAGLDQMGSSSSYDHHLTTQNQAPWQS